MSKSNPHDPEPPGAPSEEPTCVEEDEKLQSEMDAADTGECGTCEGAGEVSLAEHPVTGQQDLAPCPDCAPAEHPHTARVTELEDWIREIHRDLGRALECRGWHIVETVHVTTTTIAALPEPEPAAGEGGGA